MDIRILDNETDLGAAAAGAAIIREALASRRKASVIRATGASHFEEFECLVRAPASPGTA